VNPTFRSKLPSTIADGRPVFSRAEGIYVWDREGRRYLDATSGAFCVQLGYTRPDLVRAMAEAAERLPYARPSEFESEEGEAYRRELLAAAGPPFARVVLTSSGSEAVEVALKIAHVYQRAIGSPERGRVEYLEGHYHGATLGALGVTGWKERRVPYEALLGPARTGPVEKSGKVAAIIQETIPAAGLGVQVPVPGHLAELRARCDESGALWIADEVLTGFGRVGALFAWKRLGAIPDLIVFGKGAGAGFAPVAGVLITERVARELDAAGFTHHQTYGGNPIAAAVGRRVLQAMAEERIDERVRENEVVLWNALDSLRANQHVSDVRGLGYLWGVELLEDVAAGRPFHRERQIAEQIAAACREQGVLVHAGAGSVDGDRGDFILIAPPLISLPGVFGEIGATLRAAIDQVAPGWRLPPTP